MKRKDLTKTRESLQALVSGISIYYGFTYRIYLLYHNFTVTFLLNGVDVRKK